MDFNAYLKIDGVPGEVTDASHKGWIEVVSFSWGASRPGIRPGSAIGAGKPVFQAVSVVKRVDKSSPRLMTACAGGAGFKTCVLEVQRVVGQRPVIYGIRLTMCNLASIKLTAMGPSSVTSEGGEENLLEELSIIFKKLEVAYRQQLADGGIGPASAGGFDVLNNAVVVAKPFLT